MGRDQKDAVDFFPMNTEPHESEVFMQSEYGNDGFNFFFKLLRELGKSPRHCIDVRTPLLMNKLAVKLNLKADLVEKMLDDMVTYEQIHKELWKMRIIYYPGFSNSIKGVYIRRQRPIPGVDEILEFLNISEPETHISEPEINEDFRTRNQGKPTFPNQKSTDWAPNQDFRTRNNSSFPNQKPTFSNQKSRQTHISEPEIQSNTDFRFEKMTSKKASKAAEQESNPVPIDKERSSKGAAFFENEIFRIAAFSPSEIDDVIKNVVIIRCESNLIDNPEALFNDLKKKFRENPDKEWTAWIKQLIKNRVYTEGMRRVLPNIDTPQGIAKTEPILLAARQAKIMANKENRLKKIYKNLVPHQKQYFEYESMLAVIQKLKGDEQDFDYLMEFDQAKAIFYQNIERYRLMEEAEARGYEFEFEEEEN